MGVDRDLMEFIEIAGIDCDLIGFIEIFVGIEWI